MKVQVFSLSEGKKEAKADLAKKKTEEKNKEWRGDSRTRQERSLRTVLNLCRKE